MLLWVSNEEWSRSLLIETTNWIRKGELSGNSYEVRTQLFAELKICPLTTGLVQEKGNEFGIGKSM